MTELSRRDVGRMYENLACAHLITEGHSILDRNFSTRQGEIDIVSMHRGVLVFTEVKFRQNSRYGTAAAAVVRGKQRKMVRTALLYMKSRGYTESQCCRFDVIGIDAQGHIEHIENAIELGNVMNRQHRRY